MKQFLHILILLFAATAFSGVSWANAKVPAFTSEPEKVFDSAPAEVNTTDDGAIPFTPYHNYDAAFCTEALTVKKILWAADETFYLIGYKAKLSDAVREIIAPPDSKDKYRAKPRNGCRCAGCHTG